MSNLTTLNYKKDNQLNDGMRDASHNKVNTMPNTYKILCLI